LRDLPAYTLPDTATLLVSGGDARITLDPVSGLSMYGCRPCPDPELIAFGSSTASLISTAGFAAADALRQTLRMQLRDQSAAAVYALHTERLRSDLLEQCGVSRADGVAGVDVVLAASGTDVHLLAAQWLRPQRTVSVTKSETGSGVPAALRGQHFNTRTAGGDAVAIGMSVADWTSDLFTVAARAPDGTLRDDTAVDTDTIAQVTHAVEAGHHVLLILTDVSKTGLIVPGIATVLRLKNRWPAHVTVLVDACQFRLSATTIRAYLAQDCMVALTGSKFVSGPTFCGALLIPPAIATRYRDWVLSSEVGAYSTVADWPAGWLASRLLPDAANFGLLLRWEAALTELRPFIAIPESLITAFLQRFSTAVHARLTQDTYFETLAVPTLCRPLLGKFTSWDAVQTIFSFMIYQRDAQGGRRPLSHVETVDLYQRLNASAGSAQGRRIQLGQPVPCGDRNGVAASALRLCVSAPMVVTACQNADNAEVLITQALVALDRITHYQSAR
jgi:hypothetical protein